MKNKKTAFTLVELIVTIVILVILASIGFISVIKYTSMARDTQRQQDLKSIEEVIGYYETNNYKFPLPDNITGRKIDEKGVEWIVGTFGTGNTEEVKQLNKALKDPTTGKFFEYSVSKNGKAYMLKAKLEKGEDFILQNPVRLAKVGEDEVPYTNIPDDLPIETFTGEKILEKCFSYEIYNGEIWIMGYDGMKRDPNFDYTRYFSYKNNWKLFIDNFIPKVYAQAVFFIKPYIRGTSLGCPKNVVIPETIDGKPVRVISMGAFQNLGLTSIKFHKNLEYIFYGTGEYSEGATFGGNNLTTLDIPSSIKGVDFGPEINRNNIILHNYISNLLINNSILYLDDGTNLELLYSINKNKTHIEIPETIDGKPINYIYDFAFLDNKLESVTIPNSIYNKTKLIFKDGIFFSDEMGDKIIVKYNGNKSNKTINIPEKINGKSVTYVGSESFLNNNLESIIIPNSVTSIWSEAFKNNNLKSVIIPNSVTYIGYEAFKNNNLESITIPNSVTGIGNKAFKNNNLQNVTILNKNTKCYNSTNWQNCFDSGVKLKIGSNPEIIVP